MKGRMFLTLSLVFFVLSSYALSADKLNINTATVEELITLPGVGETVAKRIVEYREKNGSFKAIEELMNVKGIGPKRFKKIKDLVTVGEVPTPTPVP